MALISLHNLTLGFGGPPLFADLTLDIQAGERIGLCGRNGCGKSTLLGVLAGEIEHDQGEIRRPRGTQVALLDQRVPEDLKGTVYDVVSSGLGEQGRLLTQYHKLGLQLEQGSDSAAAEKTLAEMQVVQEAIEAADGWSAQQEVERVLTRLDLGEDEEVSTLSAGMKRRVLLARVLVSAPDILLLDEPTNHLDIESITWLEEFLLRYEGTLLFVSHDRVFLEKLATRILELDRAQLYSYSSGYQKFLVLREQRLEEQARDLEKLDKKLVEEEAWLRKGIRARRTRNEGRVRALKNLRTEREDMREAQGRVKAKLGDGARSGRNVIAVKNLNYSIAGLNLVSNFSTRILRGDKIGLIGPNGVGKSTLIRLLLGELTPNSGTVDHGTQLEIAYFDQLHSQLDESKTVVENVGDGQDWVDVAGQQRPIYGYLQDFLFTPDRAKRPIQNLSGGERNRLLLAKLFTKAANLFVLDEPTNDLDAETLDLLENLLVEYSGTVLIVSHDRRFLDNVVTSCFAFEGDGVIREVVGGYQEWWQLQQDRQQQALREKEAAKQQERQQAKKLSPVATKKKSKLSWSESKELESLPGLLEEFEQKIEAMHSQMSQPDFYKGSPELIANTTQQLTQLERDQEKAFTRWEQLDSNAG